MSEQVGETKRTNFSLSVETQALERYMVQGIGPSKFWSYDELDKAAGCDVRKRGCLETVRKHLLSRGHVLGAVTGAGVRILENEEVATSGARDARHVHSKARNAIRRMETAEYEKLPKAKQAEYNASMTILAVFRQFGTYQTRQRILGRVQQELKTLPVGETMKMFEK